MEARRNISVWDLLRLSNTGTGPYWHKLEAMHRRLSGSRLTGAGLEFGIIACGQLATVAGSILGVRILIELVTPQTYGEVALAQTAVTLAQIALLGPIGNGISRHYSTAQHVGELRRFGRAALQVTVAVAALYVTISSLLLWVLAKTGKSYLVPVATIAVLVGLTSGCNTIVNGFQNAARKRTTVAIHQTTSVWSRYIFACLGVRIFAATSVVVLLAQALSGALVLVSQAIHVRSLAKSWGAPARKLQDQHWASRIFTYGTTFVPWGLAEFTRNASERWSLQLYTSTHTVGIYAVMYQFAYYPLVLVGDMASQFLAPIVFQRVGDSTNPESVRLMYRRLWALTACTLGLSGTIAFGCWLFGQTIIDAVIDTRYSAPVSLWAGLLGSAGILVSSRFISMTFHAHLKTHVLILPRVSIEALGAALSIVGARAWGLSGLVLAGVIYSGVLLLMLTVLSVRNYNRTYEVNGV